MQAEDIIARFHVARGGLDRIRAINSIAYKGQRTMADGAVLTMHTWRKRPNLIKVAFQVDGGAVGVEGYDGSRAWEAIPSKTDAPVYVDGAAETALIRASDIDGALIDSAAKGHRFTDVVERDFNDRPVYAVTMQRADGNRIDYLFDRETGLQIGSETVRAVHAGPEERTVTTVEDYRAVNGVLFGFMMDERSAVHREVLRWHSIETNLPLDDHVFAMPETMLTALP